MTASKLRRGFGAEANRWALDLRIELGLAGNAPLLPRPLAEHLGIPIYELSQFPPSTEQQLLLNRKDGHDFSAAVCFDGLAAFILLNDGNDQKRQASDIAHEIAHILLRHPPANPFQGDGIREFSPDHELEAERLGPTLLLSDHAALNAYRLITRGVHDLESLSNQWGITKEVIQMRINLSGARRRIPQAA